MKDNKLIAEFMGWELQDNPKERWYGSYREPKEAGYYHRNTTTDPLLFHCSWDWLMPVIEKIGTHTLSSTIEMLSEYYYKDGDNQDGLESIEEFHKAVVFWIKNNNFKTI